MKAIEEIDGSAARRPCRKATGIMVAYRSALAAWTSPGGDVRGPAFCSRDRTEDRLLDHLIGGQRLGMVRPRVLAVLRLMTELEPCRPPHRQIAGF